MKIRLLSIAVSLSILSVSTFAAPILNSVSVHSKAYQNNEAINALISPYIGKEIDIKLLQKILSEVSRYYHDLGYISSQAFYPEQSTDKGNLLIEIAHPKLANLNLNNLVPLNSYAMSVLFNDLKSYQGQYFSEYELTSKLYKLNDLGQFSLKRTYAQSSQPKSVDLNLTLGPVKKFNFIVFADNYGTKSSGRIRGGAQMQVNNITNSADVLSLFYARSQEKQNNFNLSYEIPVSSHPTILGTSLCLSDYELADEYKFLGAQGNSLSFELYLKEPLIRTSNLKLNLQGGGRYKKLSDEFANFDVEFKKHSLAGFISCESIYIKNKISLDGKITLTSGQLYNDDDWDLYDEGCFTLTSFDGSLNYKCSQYLSLRDELSWQIGSHDLESSERFVPVGADRLSAYDSNIISADSGIFNSASLEITPFNQPCIKISPHFDSAYATESNRSEKLFGAGLRINYQKGGFFINSSFDFPVGHKPCKDVDDFKIFLRTGFNYA